MEARDVGKTVQKDFTSFLSGRPIWAYLIAYTALSGILFGVFYTAMYLMASRWWIPLVVIVAVGMLWGAIAYTVSVHDGNDEKAPGRKTPGTVERET